MIGNLILFVLGLWGIFLNRKNFILMVMSIELLLLSVNLNLIMFSIFLDDLAGQILAIFVFTVAAAESAIGLSILVAFYRLRGTISLQFTNLLKG